MGSIFIIGGGLAGCEAAWQASRLGAEVTLYEMRPLKTTPAHHTDLLAELVCSNSLRATSLSNAVGLLKEEMKMADSLIMQCAEKSAVPAGGALAVDRTHFAELMTESISENPRIKLLREEVVQIPEHRPLIIATGPLSSDALSGSLASLTGEEYLSFYDAVAPLVSVDSINTKLVFRQSRYDKGAADYLNAPLNEEEYKLFWENLVSAEVNDPKAFERGLFFEGCLPVEVMARRGFDTLRYGPLKPVGLIDPRTGKEPYAVVQLRQDDTLGTTYNLVGFQTQLKWSEQKRVFRMIPGLDNAEFLRFGVMHKNTFLNGPMLLQPTLQMKRAPEIICAGQITGVEGYVESAASGLIAGINSAYLAQGKEPLIPPQESAHGALCWYVATSVSLDFQPMNVNFGLFPPLSKKLPKRHRIKAIADRALSSWSQFIAKLE
ncbi:MAG TPA: methylenetetrahydrofolate--tRNA-(uracil(54)-C(5))-methyltransferase (FADH(2)-oxidizing) TrmFO [Peptococcaceae bacterium]|mgnify:CR=1 FL=1|jgi:methylenetetrahydrofolate--tRNA-(uracil-5-)-methyltransferase|nr:methylenetetrahydrofolate--tRNA-(uracil(54)-C(5))-methyltransferase (FADH(2)-oxidizing) TrmFO [Peptococcaceae bacterium]